MKHLPIFCNDNIRVGNRTVFQKSWIDNRVCYIKNILNENGKFMSFQSFKEKYRINTIYITCIGYVHAVKSYIRRTGLTVEGNSSVDLRKKHSRLFTINKKEHIFIMKCLYRIQINKTAVRSGKLN